MYSAKKSSALDGLFRARRVAIGIVRAASFSLQDTLEQVVELGNVATPFVAIVMLMLGMLSALIVSLVARFTFASVAGDYVEASFPEILGYAFASQIAPMLTAVLIAGSNIVAMTAELARMRADQEIDSLQVIGINPITYLLLPRALALLALTPALTLMGLYLGLIGGWLIEHHEKQIGFWLFLSECFQGIDRASLVNALAKSIGAAIWMAAMSGVFGLSAVKRARGTVGRSATAAVISSMVGIIALNLLLTWQFISK